VIRAGLIAAAGLALAVPAAGADVPSAQGAWELVRLDGARPPIPATLTIENGRLSGRAFCNGFGGGYRIRSGRLVTNEVASTRMLCQREDGFDIMAAERRYLATLSARPRLKLGPEGLFLRAENGSTLQFRRMRSR
jgi:heat shock protein HslJ